jgi:hypothetical protein
MRVLVTGSRNWANRQMIHARLVEAAGMAAARGEHLIVVHGGAAGADLLADDWVAGAQGAGWRVYVDQHPAEWPDCAADCPPGHRKKRRDRTEYCPTAGHRRNAEMVALGPDLCLAFVMPCGDERCRKPRPHWSHGADDCANRAEAAGVATVRVGADGQEVGR